jgi:SAM-dependent methyltransferase
MAAMGYAVARMSEFVYEGRSMTKHKNEGVHIPEHWSANTWEEKARENPLFAVMTTPNYTNSDSKEFTQEELDYFFEKGRRVYAKIVKPRLGLIETGVADPLLVEYGCGMGRILKAAVEDGKRVGGIDISATMIEHCRNFVPASIDNLYVLDSANRSQMPKESADLVFSFAVLKHIPSLKVYYAALDEIMRVMKPGAPLLLNVNCQDFIHGSFDKPGKTINHETYSEHFRFGEKKPYKSRTYSTWSGVYIGYEQLAEKLKQGGLEILDRFHHTPKKFQGIWVIARKRR